MTTIIRINTGFGVAYFHVDKIASVVFIESRNCVKITMCNDTSYELSGEDGEFLLTAYQAWFYANYTSQKLGQRVEIITRLE